MSFCCCTQPWDRWETLLFWTKNVLRQKSIRYAFSWKILSKLVKRLYASFSAPDFLKSLSTLFLWFLLFLPARTCNAIRGYTSYFVVVAVAGCLLLLPMNPWAREHMSPRAQRAQAKSPWAQEPESPSMGRAVRCHWLSSLVFDPDHQLEQFY
jgi:hypothetical protein